MTVTLIRGGRLIDPSTGRDEQGDLLLRDGVIAADSSGDAEADRIVEAAGMIVAPGLIETQATLREPAWDDED
ncbi:MAG: dihydroorotase, partial [Planctomycetaceae bacterium]